MKMMSDTYLRCAWLCCGLVICITLVGLAKEHVDSQQRSQHRRVLVLALARDTEHEAFKRFNQSVHAYGLNMLVLETSQTHAVQKQTSELLAKSLESYARDPNLLVLLALDPQNTIVNGHERDVLDKFALQQGKVLFTSDNRCWPDATLVEKYPPSDADRFLNSALVVGNAQALLELIAPLRAGPLGEDVSLAAKLQQSAKTNDNLIESFQTLCTRAYIDEQKRNQLGLAIDFRAQLVQSLRGHEADLALELHKQECILTNTVYKTNPVILYNNQDATSQVTINSLGNYLGKAWTLEAGCAHCNDTRVPLDATGQSLPSVLVGVFIEEPTPFMDRFFASLVQLNYTHERMHLYIHNSVKYHEQHVGRFLDAHGARYASVHLDSVTSAGPEELSELVARSSALERCKRLGCDYYLSLDSVARLDEPNTLRVLIETNRTIVAPMLSRPHKLWSNFWAAITEDGYYARSHDYVDLVSQNRTGIWNVPHIMNAYLIRGDFIRKNLLTQTKIAYANATIDDGADIDMTTNSDSAAQNDNNNNNKFSYATDAMSAPPGSPLTYYEPSEPSMRPVVAFSRNLRARGIFQWLINVDEYGHLVDPTRYDINATHPDFGALIDNMFDWEHEYLHENYSRVLDAPSLDPDSNTYANASSTTAQLAASPIEEPCTDVYWFPLVNAKFNAHIIETMEAFGQWSAGKNEDPRIDGGYESVPTRDIHMRQIGLHEMWLFFLREYVMPVQQKQFIGYEHDPPTAELAFVVRYNPSEQPSLRPHHDTSTYTLNIALNSPGQDYSGGGCRFIRYNCSVTDSRPGWALIHPGRLTHYHEGLPVTNGTRYIMVTFIDP